MSDQNRHSEAVLDWRKLEFERMGFVSYVAGYLSETRIDLHQMQDLLDRGCPHEQALEIMMGTMWSGEDDAVQWTDSELEALYEYSQ